MNPKKNEYAVILPLETAREELRRRAMRQSETLARSVARLTSSDAQPCLEYRDEVLDQYAMTDELLYLQQCRQMLERCIAHGSAKLRYRRQDGTTATVRCSRLSLGRVKIYGLV